MQFPKQAVRTGPLNIDSCCRYLTAVNVLLPGGVSIAIINSNEQKVTILTRLWDIQRAVLYDGSPFIPDIQTFLRLIGDQKYVKNL
jgi:hypothetical protein